MLDRTVPADGLPHPAMSMRQIVGLTWTRRRYRHGRDRVVVNALVTEAAIATVAPICHAPCPYLPGTLGKVLWLAARYRRQLPLWHDGDRLD